MHFKDKRVLSIKTPEDMLKILNSKGNSLSSYKKGSKITVYNKMEANYSYVLAENPGKNFAEGFEPELTPAKMLELGVFEGKYLNDCLLEFPKEWFLKAIDKGKLSPEGANPEINLYKVKSRLDLDQWEDYGWVPNPEGHIAKQYPIALTLTLKQTIVEETAFGITKRAISVEDCKRIAKRFMQKLNKLVFKNAAKRYNKSLKYVVACEGINSYKNLHLHLQIGNFPSHIKLNNIDNLIAQAKALVSNIDMQYKVDIADNGWAEYITKEITNKNSDSIFWDLM